MKSCFFTGYESYSYKDDPDALDYFANLVEILVENGVTDFYSGGSLGWDNQCEFSIQILKLFFSPKENPLVKIHLILPCPPEIHSQNWSEKERFDFEARLSFADSIEIVSDKYDETCIEKRNARLVELGDICVCYFNRNDFSGSTGQTVRMAEKANKIIFNLNFLNKCRSRFTTDEILQKFDYCLARAEDEKLRKNNSENPVE